jgi:hypothetical protein
VFKESLVGFENLCLCDFYGVRVVVLKGLSQGLFCFVLVFAEFLEDGVSLGSACVKSGLLFGCHFQHGVDDGGIHLVLEFMTLEVTVGAVLR